MRKNLHILIFLTFLVFLVYHNAFSNFFAQDDFILLQKFSGGNLLQNIIKSLTSYHQTNWRPAHYLFFLISGSVFGKNYPLYHVLLYSIHLSTSYLIFLAGVKLLKNRTSALVSSVIYAIHPFNFVSLFWISGGATELAFMFFLISFIFWLKHQFRYSLLFYLISLLASESMIVGLIIIYIWEVLNDRVNEKIGDLKIFFVFTFLFAILKFIFLTPKVAYNVYGVSVSLGTVFAFKYYLLRVLGFAEANGDLVISIALCFWIFVLIILFSKKIKEKLQRKNIIFFFVVLIVGMLPFLTIPNHLSAHYMNVSVWALASFVAILLSGKKVLCYLMLFVFIVVCVFSTKTTEGNNWITARAQLSKEYISRIEKDNLPRGSTLVFGNNNLSSSLDAYYALGGGDGINFWFKNKNYKYCFTEFESCSALP
jgi:hypothetical protein